MKLKAKLKEAVRIFHQNCSFFISSRSVLRYIISICIHPPFTYSWPPAACAALHSPCRCYARARGCLLPSLEWELREVFSTPQAVRRNDLMLNLVSLGQAGTGTPQLHTGQLCCGQQQGKRGEEFEQSRRKQKACKKKRDQLRISPVSFYAYKQIHSLQQTQEQNYSTENY